MPHAMDVDTEVRLIRPVVQCGSFSLNKALKAIYSQSELNTLHV